MSQPKPCAVCGSKWTWVMNTGETEWFLHQCFDMKMKTVRMSPRYEDARTGKAE